MKNKIIKDIKDVTSKLLEFSLASDVNSPAENNGSIYISGKYNNSVSLKSNLSYEDVYNTLEKERNYNIKMIDGALIQMMYFFNSKKKLLKHRLVFFPAPYLESYQNNSQIYDSDELYGDIIKRKFIGVPLRFDYDPTSYKSVLHPKSHLTLGDYKNSRIPVKGVITPKRFISFILQNFYDTEEQIYSKKIKLSNYKLDDTIDNAEKKLLHISFKTN